MANILVIDDDEAVRYSVRKILESQKHSVSEADNGHAGLALFQKDAFDLIITDIIMPDKDGIKTISEVKEASPETPIIAMSGGGRFGGDEYIRTAKIIGASRVISKPFLPAELLDCVDGCLSKS